MYELRYRLGAQAFADWATLAWARGGPRVSLVWRGIIALAEDWTPPAFPLSGDDVMAAGVAKGPKVGEVLRQIEDWWIDRDFADDREAAMAKLATIRDRLRANGLVKLGILKTGRPPRPAIPQFGTYPEMFIRPLGPGDLRRSPRVRGRRGRTARQPEGMRRPISSPARQAGPMSRCRGSRGSRTFCAPRAARRRWWASASATS